jgi:hypothetical protein
MHVKDYPGYDPGIRAHDDEKAYGLLETDLYTDIKVDGETVRVTHRFQIIDFLRGNDRLKEVNDLVKDGVYSMLDNHPPMRIIIALEHGVGEAKEIAHAARERKKARDVLREAEEKSTLIEDVIERSERIEKIRRRESFFGPTSTGRTTGHERSR